MISPSAEAGKLVICLCSLEVPITVPQPRSPELMRYRFFLHTRWEEGGRRHRLYMGYFTARREADKWLGTLRRIYPTAFVTMAPEAQTLTGSQIVSLLDQPVSQTAPPAMRERRPAASLEDTVEALKQSSTLEINDEDSLSETGVRHLRIEIERAPSRASGRRKP